MILVGSTVLSKYIPIKVKDRDYIGITDDKPQNCDYLKVPEEIYSKLLEYSNNNELTLEGLYNLKASHLEFDLNWWKHSKHLILIQEKYNLKINNDFYKVLNTYWKSFHKKNVRLTKSKQDFFNKSVKREYDHDYLHELVKHEDVPLYKKILKDNHDILPSEKKFNNLSFEQKINLAREEVYVIALERYIIPRLEEDYKTAYRKSIHKVVTSLTTGWFTKFMIDNLYLLKNYEKEYWKFLLNE